MLSAALLFTGLLVAQAAQPTATQPQQPQIIMVPQSDGTLKPMMVVPIETAPVAQPVAPAAPVVQPAPVPVYAVPAPQPQAPANSIRPSDDSYYKYNVGTNTLGYVIGLFSFSGGVALSRNLALRSEFNLYKNYFGEGWGIGGGLGLPIFFQKAWKGFFIQPGAKVMYFDVGSTELVAGGPESLVGFQWQLRNGITLALAGGLQFLFVSNKSADNDDLGAFRKGVFPSGYFHVGKAF